ncbi:hypothetical protein J2Z50_003069 [Ensifer mexicanus]|nr:hypothetical protein [Sinorhizobium mexicanum]
MPSPDAHGEGGQPSPFDVVVSTHESAGDPPMYRYVDDKLTDVVRPLDLIPKEALANEELLHDFI